MAMVGAGFGALVLTGVLFATLPMTFQPPLNLDYLAGQFLARRLARRSSRPKPSPTRSRRSSSADPEVERVLSASTSASGHLNIGPQKGPQEDQHRVRTALAPQLASIPDARVSFQSQNGGGPGGDSRDIMLFLGGEDPVKLNAVANKIAERNGDYPGASRAARRAATSPSRRSRSSRASTSPPTLA